MLRETPFSIIRMPYLSSNMPSKIFYASLGDESEKYYWTWKFKSSCAKIISTIIKQGATKSKNKQRLYKIYGPNLEIFRSFSATYFYSFKYFYK